jgi:succinate-semialdehyde dehydrogenase / glutarate-semialdehyde dehydrogenase
MTSGIARKVSFTGSTGVGKILLRQAAENVMRSSMELGGNAPFIVLSDAEVERAVDGAMQAKMRNMGEACTAANRFFVHRSLAQEFGEKLALLTDPWVFGSARQGGAVAAEGEHR